MPQQLQLLGPRSRRSEPQPTDPIRVVLADPHIALRHTLSWLISAEDDLAVVAEASDVGTALAGVDRGQPHVLLLDAPMRDGSTLATIRHVRARLPDTQIVVISMDASPTLAERAIAAGALGFVLKEHACTDLPQAVRLAASGEAYVSPALEARVRAITRLRPVAAHRSQ